MARGKLQGVKWFGVPQFAEFYFDEAARGAFGLALLSTMNEATAVATRVTASVPANAVMVLLATAIWWRISRIFKMVPAIATRSTRTRTG